MAISTVIKTKAREQVVDVTGLIQQGLTKSKYKSGKVVVTINQPAAALANARKKPQKPDRQVIRDLLDRGCRKKGFHYHSPMVYKVMKIGGAAMFLNARDGKLEKTNYPVKLLCELDGPREIILKVRVMVFKNGTWHRR